MTAQGPLTNAEQLGRIWGKKYLYRSRPTRGRQNGQNSKSPDLGPGMAGDAPGGPKGTQGHDVVPWGAVGYYIGPYQKRPLLAMAPP